MSILIRRIVRTVAKSIWKMRTLIGLVVHIDHHGAGKCGGVAAKRAKKHKVANIQSIRAKKMKKILLSTMKVKKSKLNASNVCAAKS